ncbi:LAMI_0H18998g1_1 [Lachancea mirantina]|uniref:LAMI_0H18998g1_1 n=1 Tax=Lachancea mirantina TaxID=1230905 RepID=A0A1G4KJY2_9SACH|nr:LAMI_0H18998g1_1 [Lachancea mirantina]
MSTVLFPDDYFGGPPLCETKNNEAEKIWLIEEIIKPELPNIMDNMEKCLELLLSDVSFKMPISGGGGTSKSNSGISSIRGVVTRQNCVVTDFHAIVKFPQYNWGKPIMFKMDTSRKYVLEQIRDITKNLKEALLVLEDLQQEEDPQEFIKKIATVLNLLSRSINVLENPPRQLLFPENGNDTLETLFTHTNDAPWETAHHFLNLELVIFKNEVSIEVRNLKKETALPWSRIDATTGKSFTDTVRERLKEHREKSLAEVLKAAGLRVEERSFLQSVFPNSKSGRTTMEEAQYMLSRSVTFHGHLVSESDKVSATTSDPTLISITSKLNGLESCLSNHFTNLGLI